MTKAYYIAGTHWDREWYVPFQEYRMWLVQNMDEALDRLEADPEYKVFHLDGQAVMIEDYLEIRPEQRARVSRLLAEGRLVAGPWFAMPDLWLVSGEALIRNLNLGMKTIRGLGAEPMPVGYGTDLFGHIASMPTIYCGLGLPNGVVWRGVNEDQTAAQFIWVGPDGSRLLTHRLPCQIGYGWMGAALRWPWKEAGYDDAFLREKAPGIIKDEQARGAVPLIYLSDCGDHQAMPQHAQRMLAVLRESCPEIEFVYGSITDYFVALESHRAELTEFHGELRTPARKTGNLYHALIPHCVSARVPLKQANDRCQALLQLWAEPMAALALSTGNPLPPGFLETAWKWLIKNQPHDSICGCSTDETHDDMPFRFHQAELLADGVRRQGMAQFVSPVAEPDQLYNLAVWNPLPWNREDVCEVDLLFPTDYAAKAIRSGHTGPLLNQFELHDAAGQALPYQVLDVEQKRLVKVTAPQGRRQTLGKPVDVYRVAVRLDLLATGHTGLTIHPIEGVGALERHLGTLRRGPLSAENEHLSLSVAPNGIVELTNKADGRVYRDLFQYSDSGDTGDGWSFVPPIRNRLVVSPGHDVTASIEEDGPLQVTFRIDRVLQVPAELDPGQRERRAERTVDLRIIDRLTLRMGDPMLHVSTQVDNTACDHRLQVLFPSGIASDTYWSDQPFAWVERPVAIDPGSSHYKEPDPIERPHHSVFAIADKEGGLAVLCPEGLHEHVVEDDINRTLALTLFRAFGATVQTDGEPGPQLLGPLSFHYALLPFSGTLPRADMLRRVAELQSGIATYRTELPVNTESLLRVDGADEIVVSAIKPGSDGTSLMVRLWNTGSMENRARIRLASPVKAASLCSLAEQPLAELVITDGAVDVQVAPYALATVRLEACPAG